MGSAECGVRSVARSGGGVVRGAWWVMSGAFGQGAVRVGGGSNFSITSLQGPGLTSLGLAWRSETAVLSSLIASRKLVGGLAVIMEASSDATSSTEVAPQLMAMRL